MISAQDIRAVMAIANIKFPKKPHSMVIFLIKVRICYGDLSSQADPREIIELEVIHISLKTHVSRKVENTIAHA